ncbi:MAG: hypothetical protein KTR31_19635 [Myxococcales bacterium]|nr:hypothetical protein [Myxococcales bacterium]
MTNETVTLKQRSGDPVEGTAVVTRYAATDRTTRAGAIALGGILLGGLSIVVPGVHLISTWLLPLLGLGIAAYVHRIHARVGTVRGICPSCGEDMAIEDTGAVADEAVWVRCDRCTHPMELILRPQ